MTRSQPDPIVNNHDRVHEVVARDVLERMELGMRRYGTPLHAFNGRDALWDAYEEAIDLACYLRQAIIEREAKGE